MDVATDTLLHLTAEELRERAQSLRQTVSFKKATIDKLTHENALLKRLKFAAQSERFSAEQRSLLEETLVEDTQAVHDEMAELNTEPIPALVKDQPKRQPLPAHLPRIDIRHEPDATTCHCGCQMQCMEEMWPRSWTTSRVSSVSSATCVANGPAPRGRLWCRRRWRRTSSTKAEGQPQLLSQLACRAIRQACAHEI